MSQRALECSPAQQASLQALSTALLPALVLPA
jgi:hypothetical protein